jgi:hypothetical protein
VKNKKNARNQHGKALSRKTGTKKKISKNG